MLERWSRPAAGLWNGIASVVGGVYGALGPVALLDVPAGRRLGRPRPRGSRQVSYLARIADGQVELQGPSD